MYFYIFFPSHIFLKNINNIFRTTLLNGTLNSTNGQTCSHKAVSESCNSNLMIVSSFHCVFWRLLIFQTPLVFFLACMRWRLGAISWQNVLDCNDGPQWFELFTAILAFFSSSYSFMLRAFYFILFFTLQGHQLIASDIGLKLCFW